MDIPDLPYLPESIFKIIFEKSPGSLVVKADKPHFTILGASDAYLQVTSVKREHVLGKGFFEIFPDNNDDPDDVTTARKVFTKVVETKIKIDVPSYRFDTVNVNDDTVEEHYWSCSNIPILSPDGEVAYILNTVVDITEEVMAKKAAIESESRLRLAAEAAGLATWELNVQNNDFNYSTRLAEIFGHPADSVITLDLFRNQVHPDDFENIVIKAYQQSLVTGNYLYEVRIFWPDESLHWIKTQGKVLYDEKNEPTRMLGTILDITENKRDEIRKNDFIAMASHELKTPLTSLKAYIQLLMGKLSDSADPFVTSALNKSNNQINKMTSLIHGFLDLSKMEPGKLQLKSQLFDINKLIEEIIAESRINFSSHLLQFKFEDEFMVSADKEKIGQVLNNFLSNAMKYSPKGTTIKIHSCIDNNHIKVTVTDKGIGIDQKDQEKLFQRFYRVDNEQMKNVSGFGIGLYLSSEIIQRHKGKIGVTSKEGKGSSFYFSLPIAS